MCKPKTKIPKIYHLNIIVLFIITFCTFGVTFLAKQLHYKFIYTGMLFVLLSMYGYHKKALQFTTLYILFFLWFLLNLNLGIKFPAPLLFTFALTVIPMVMTGYLLTQVPLGKITTALRQMRLPEKLILITIVTIRFIPTTLTQIFEVKNAMKVRGLLSSPCKVLQNPGKTFEYAVVPMVFYSLKISDELAASCIARGIESPCKKNGYYLNQLGVMDIVLSVIFLFATIYFVT